jgi:hypothetical protein
MAGNSAGNSPENATGPEVAASEPAKDDSRR